MISEDKKYIYGSAAPKIEYDVYQNNKVLKTKRRYKRNNKIKFKAVCCILVFFASFSYIMYMYAQLTEYNYKLNTATKEYNEIKNDNIRSKLEMQKDLDLNKIREIAENRLDMHKPDKFQVVYVNVQKNDFTEIANESQQTQEKSFFASVSKVVGKIFGFLC